MRIVVVEPGEQNMQQARAALADMALQLNIWSGG
jgi:hypothetical protein